MSTNRKQTAALAHYSTAAMVSQADYRRALAHIAALLGE